ncbi:hypothetical protein ACOMHN_023224 [Nucella lapillus]
MEPRSPTPILLLLSLSLTLPSLSPSSLSYALTVKAPVYHQQLVGWAEMLRQARTADTENSHAANLRPSEWRDVILKAASLLTEDDVRGRLETSGGGLMTSLEQNATMQLCLNHTMATVAGILEGEKWGLHMLDAMGKPLPGIAEGDVNWPGDYNQCLRVTANTTVTSHPYFSGRYCTVLTQPPPAPGLMGLPMSISLGLCVPDTCSSQDVTLLLQTVVKALNMTSSLQPTALCQEGDMEVNAKAIVAIVICSVILALMILGTAVDLLVIQWPKWSAQRRQKEEDLLVEDNGEEKSEGEGEGHGEYGSVENHHHHQNAVTNPEYETLLPKAKVKTPVAAPQLGVVGKVVVSFSVWTNGSKLLGTDQPSGSLTCVHGVRFLSMSWVVLGHTWGMPASIGMNLLPYLQDLISHWSYQGITNATVSVDSFFVLSGLLVAYLTLKEMKKRQGKLNWFLFYFHRFWRLTPAYMLCLMVYACLSIYWSQGPFRPEKLPDGDFCADNWWTNLLYVNNLVNIKEPCFGVSWYLANDMQFYILSPLIFVPLFFIPWVGVLVSVFFLLLTSIVPGVLSQHYTLPPGLLQQVEGATPNSFMDYFDIYYFKPYNRMGPYVIGMLAGYILYRTDCKLRIHWLTNLCAWSVATASALAVLYGLFESSNGHPVTVAVAALYNAVSRQVWGACVAWVVVACATGNGGFVNTILSWSALIPLSRLTYCIYLQHLTVLQLIIGNARNPFYLNDLNLTLLYIGVLVASFAVAFVTSLAFEAPMMSLERAFLKPAPSQRPHKQ